MRTYVLKRLLGIGPTILMITFVVFVMMQSVPGDPAVALLGDAYTAEDAERTSRSSRRTCGCRCSQALPSSSPCSASTCSVTGYATRLIHA